jgi:hypothetical protein
MYTRIGIVLWLAATGGCAGTADAQGGASAAGAATDRTSGSAAAETEGSGSRRETPPREAHPQSPGRTGAEPTVPRPFRARYRGGLGAVDARVSLAGSGEFLKYEYRTRLAGREFYDCSIVQARAGVLTALEHVQRERSGERRRDLEVRLEPGARRVTIVRGGEARRMDDVRFPVWDTLSVQLQIMADLATKRPALRYAVADKGGIKEYRFRVGDGEAVRYAGREYAALTLERDEDAPRFQAHLAPQLDYVPVRLAYHTKLLGWVSATLEELEFPAATPASPGTPRPRCDSP